MSRSINEELVGQRLIVLPVNIKKAVAGNELIKRCYLTEMGYYYHAANHCINRKTGSPQYILLYCADGKGSLIVHGNEIELTPETYFIVPPNTPHYYQSFAEDLWSIYWVHFTGEYADLLYRRYDKQKKSANDPLCCHKRNLQRFNEILELLENCFYNKEIEIINIQLLSLLASIILGNTRDHN